MDAIWDIINELMDARYIYENINSSMLEAKLEEMENMSYFLGRLESGERSKLKYLIADLVEIAQDVADIGCEGTDMDNFYRELNPLQDQIKMLKSRMINFATDEKRGGGEEAEEVVVGLEEAMKQLVEKTILNKDMRFQTLSIKGMIGIGKTTLARQVYKAVEGQFQRRAWVCLSSGTSKKEILMELIQQMEVGYGGLIERDSSLEEMDNRSLQRILRQHLQGMAYFIVFDNTLEEMLLKSILKVLPREECGSRLLFTSCYEYRRIYVYHTHEMKALDSDKSWRLFLKTIDKLTSVENKFSKELERKGKEMLKKCGGLPIAILDVARQKAKQRLSGMEWEELFDSVDLRESLKLLEPMYHKLDQLEKPRFLHMSHFKENAIIREEKLEQIWMASGFDQARISANGLVSQSIIDVLPGGKKKFHLNSVLHMLCIQKAEEEMGFEIYRSNGDSRPSQNPRHRVIHCGREEFKHSTNQDGKHLISLIVHGGGGYLDNASPSYWESFELLKILDMEDFGIKTLWDDIGKLDELRYLGLRNNYIKEVPRSLGGLKNLQALDIYLNFLVEMPDIIREMGCLRNLYMRDVICRKPLKIDALPHLEILTYISIYDWTYEASCLETMEILLKLGVEEVDEDSDVDKLFASLAKLVSLDHLILKGFRFRSMPCLDGIGALEGVFQLRLDGHLARLPNSLEGISYLTLVNSCLNEDPMPVLEKLPNLQELKLRNAYTGREMVIQCNGFPWLSVLCINELWNLRKMQIGEGAMPFLRELEIKNCPRLETLPEEIGSMENLKKFTMVTTKQIATKIRNSGLTSRIVEEDIYP
ncbi:probable disease resistance protein At1g58602 [Salvia hispanica]|uniref:probable disease resistance protein At1g58602 n=1 Tax=Salvia hispanica TaxID=49212 RepID=UPI002009AE14|nr:probable disease resistance protein At1g58602 [Salvia hispanica]